MRPLIACLFIASLVTVGAYAQTAACTDAADEPHHQLLYQNDSTRVLLLDLPRLASTLRIVILIRTFS